MTNPYDFRDFRKKWFLLQEKWAKESAFKENTDDDLVAPPLAEIDLNELEEDKNKKADGKYLDKLLSKALEDSKYEEDNKDFTETPVYEKRRRKKFTEDEGAPDSSAIQQIDKFIKDSRDIEEDDTEDLTENEFDSIEEDDDPMGDIEELDKVMLNSAFNEEDEELEELEEVDTADVGSQVGVAPDAKILKNSKRKLVNSKLVAKENYLRNKKKTRFLREAEEIDDATKNVSDDVDQDIGAAGEELPMAGGAGGDEDVASLVSQLREKFPGKKIYITVASDDEDLDADDVAKAQEIAGGETGGEVDTEETEVTGEETPEDLENVVASKGKKKPVTPESFKESLQRKRRILFLKKLLREAEGIEGTSQEKEDFGNISKKNKKVNLPVDEETDEKSDESDENVEEITNLQSGSSDERITNKSISLTPEEWKQFLSGAGVGEGEEEKEETEELDVENEVSKLDFLKKEKPKKLPPKAPKK
ncbi:MAG: hypothetical protein NZZ41_04020 [Candidatus Dojkabacteria bacterium]|nr:hypothetical protein [Candidatus Dojkabacteria bacterium]